MSPNLRRRAVWEAAHLALASGGSTFNIADAIADAVEVALLRCGFDADPWARTIARCEKPGSHPAHLWWEGEITTPYHPTNWCDGDVDGGPSGGCDLRWDEFSDASPDPMVKQRVTCIIHGAVGDSTPARRSERRGLVQRVQALDDLSLNHERMKGKEPL